MSVVQCKICGHHIELEAGRSLMECPACGCQVTLPVVTDEGHIAAFDRGNHFRRIGEFDKALAVFERIVREDEGNAEAHWCCALCRFGIEYVRDPATQEYLPTCHRASFDSFLEDVDYLAAVKYADDDARPRYQHDAEQIASVLRGVLATSQNEKPYDVFICYKEKGADGERTRDSQLAQDVYYQLTDHGLRVFFARITLEDKPGTQFEPYIFAALQSAKVMVVIGTKPEHLSAVWVRNEWSRYLALMKHDRSRLLIPCYRDMDPYDMPEQLSILQAYDMSKIGFVQDLIRGIRKVVGEEKPAAAPQPAAAPTAAPAAPATEPLLRRVALFLEDGDWKSADEYCERVLDIDPENARAYVGKLMAELHVTRQEKLKDQAQPFDGNPNYAKALRFADDALMAELRGMIAHINDRNERAAKEAAYREAEQLQAAARTEQDFFNAHQLFAKLGEYRDAPQRAQECITKAEDAHKEEIYTAATHRAYAGCGIAKLNEAIRLLQTIPGWRDSEQQIEVLQKRIADLNTEETAERERQEKKRKYRKLGIGLTTATVCVVIVAVLLATLVIIPNGKYNDAVQLMEAGKYEESIAAFGEISWFGDSQTQINECGYRHAAELEERGEKGLAIMAFLALGDYSDAPARVKALWGEVAVLNVIAAGDNHTVGLRENGTVTAVGDNDYGQCNVSGWSDIISVAAGGNHTVGLRANGTVVATGYESACRVAGWSNIVSIAAGKYHTVGLRGDGTVVVSGSGSVANVYSWDNIIAVAAGAEHTLGLRADGTVVAAGKNDYWQCDISKRSNMIAVAAGREHSVGLRADGTVISHGNVYYGAIRVENMGNIVSIAAGCSHTVGLRADGTVEAVGSNAHGQCNTNDWKDIVAIAAGEFCTVGLREDGSVVAVGVGSKYGQSGWQLKQIPRPTLPQ